MENSKTILILLIFLSTACSGWNDQITIARFPVFIGDSPDGREFSQTIGYTPKLQDSLNGSFVLKEYISNATLSYKTLHVDSDSNQFFFNGKPASNICLAQTKKAWIQCRVEVKPSKLKKGLNTFQIKHSNSDNYGLKEIQLNINYIQEVPRLVVGKVSLPSKGTVGMPVEVGIDLSNIGYGKAYNVTSIQYKPEKLEIVKGYNARRLGVIPQDESTKYSFWITAKKPGTYSIPSGQVFYQNRFGDFYNLTIPQTSLDFILPHPNVSMIQKPVNVSVNPGQRFYLNITITNRGPGELLNVKANPSMPSPIQIIDFKSYRLPVLLENQSKTITFKFTSNTTISFIHKFQINYTRVPNEQYTKYSSESFIKISGEKIQKSGGEETNTLRKILYLLFAVIIILSIVLFFLRRRT